MTQTSITGMGCIALRFLHPHPTVRQWWQCGTALGGAISPKCTWNRGRGPSATGAPPSSIRNTPRTLTAPLSTTTPQAPVAGLSPQCSWSRVRILVPVSSTQRTCRPQTAQRGVFFFCFFFTWWFFWTMRNLGRPLLKREIIFNHHGGNYGNP